MGQEVGSGQFGLVLEAAWRDQKVAVKMVREDCMSDEDFKEEAKIMMSVRDELLTRSFGNQLKKGCACFRRKLSHRKLVQLFGMCTKRPPMCLVCEFMENGCLSDYLRERKGRLSPNVMLGMCLDVSEGMAYLESCNFIHRDLVKQQKQRLCICSLRSIY